MSRRTQRVADAIQHEIAEILLREVKDPRIGMVTLTAVEVTPDLRHARVFFSVLGDQTVRDRSLAGLRSAAGFIRAEVAHRLRLRVSPEITFAFDAGIEHADRVARLLKSTAPGDESKS